VAAGDQYLAFAAVPLHSQKDDRFTDEEALQILSDSFAVFELKYSTRFLMSYGYLARAIAAIEAVIWSAQFSDDCPGSVPTTSL